MAWPRIKNIVILILALVNLFLLVLVVSREGSDARQKAEALTSAVHILEQGGITVDESSLPREAGLTPCRVEQSRGGEEALAQALLGDVTGEERGGGVFRYTAADGSSIQFHSSGEFSASLSPTALPLQGRSAEEHAVWVMKKLDISCRVLSVEEGEDGVVSVTVCQTWEKAPVYTCTAVLRYEDAALRSITDARRLNGIPLAVEGAQQLTVPTVLICFFTESREQGYVCSAVRSLEEGYRFSASLSGPASLEPVWRVETDAGVYEVSGVTGEFSRVQQN